MNSLRLVPRHWFIAQVAEELEACIGCNECLFACPALAEPITVVKLNAETLRGPISEPVARFARACYQCGACSAPHVCPAGLHRDTMMLLLKARLLQRKEKIYVLRQPQTAKGE